MQLQTTILSLLAGAGLAHACSVTSDVTVTFYGSPDNDPPGSIDTAYDCGGRNYEAGGTGTYADPLTFASNSGEYTVCEIIYLPYLQKYLRMEDDCVQCDSDWDSGIGHIDIWTGNSVDGGSTQIDCEDALTPDATQGVVRAPDSDLEVDATVLYSGGTCNTGNVYPNAAATCSGTGTAPTGCETGCTWTGHCIGCACVTYDDCSDDFICTNSLCAEP